MGKQSEINVWDPLVRLFHWTLVGAFLITWVTEDDWMTLHSYAGYLIAGLLLFRLFWGLIGPRYARFTDFVKTPSKVIGYLKDLTTLKAKRYIGHNPAGGAMIVALLLSLLITTFTGMLAYGAVGMGPLSDMLPSNFGYGSEWFEELHEFFANFTLLLVVVHVGGVIFESLVHKENLVRSMLTGTKRA
ncbi:MAG: cytochrome b/b6 domain-containing protein [Candidatus Thiodiazotropha sp. (ex Monitilora ramsayi)]|nr:cytochrome b/b6 domain-containing protein [Candidatus Thiodiazotropha sp. (ex Monitilora ramsayi)]